MKISDIRLFIKKLEDVLHLLGFNVENKGDCYLVSFGEEKILVIPHLENVEFEIPKEQANINRVIISNYKFDSTGFKVFSLQELEHLAENKLKLGEAYIQMINVLFFGKSFTPLIDYMVNKEMLNAKEEVNSAKDINENKVETTLGETKVDIAIVERALSIKLEKKKKYYANADYGVVGIISKLYPTGNYWYGYHDYQIKILKTFNNAFMAFYFKDKKAVLLLPLSLMEEYRPKLNSTTNKNGIYWHIYFRFRNEKCLWQIPNNGFLDVTEYLINENIDDNLNANDIDSKDNIKDEVVIKIKNNCFHESKHKNK